jgi:hypothetical protein
MNKLNDIKTKITRVNMWVDDLWYADLPDSVITLAKLQILNILAVICAGATQGSKCTPKAGRR